MRRKALRVPTMILSFVLPVTLTIATLLSDASPARALTVIDTTVAWDGSNAIGQFGEPNIATFGQTFTVAQGGDTVLRRFSFWLAASTGTAQFIAFVSAWNGNLLGAPLYTSSPFDVTTSTLSEYKFQINGGIQLTAGSTYVAWLSASSLFDGVPGTAIAGYTGQDVCSVGFGGFQQGCGFVANDNGSDPALLTRAWTETREDLAFRAVFTRVPEPNSVLLVAAGLFALFLFSRSCRQVNRERFNLKFLLKFL